MAYKTQKITGPMPVHHHPDDAQWIFEQMIKIPLPKRAEVCSAYSVVYQSGMDAESTEHKKLNKARRSANVRLREFIRKQLNWQNIGGK